MIEVADSMERERAQQAHSVRLPLLLPSDVLAPLGKRIACFFQVESDRRLPKFSSILRQAKISDTVQGRLRVTSVSYKVTTRNNCCLKCG